MSTCISRQGEYSSHQVDDEYECSRCGAVDDYAMLVELRRVRAELGAAVAGFDTARADQKTSADALERVKQQLRDALAAKTVTPAPASTWRLPEWLGGHEVAEVVRENVDGVYVRLVRGEKFAVPHGVLVEVRPPSIDDPVDLPTELKDVDGYTSLTVERSPSSGGVARLTVFDPARSGGDRIRDISLTDCRQAARALWRLASEESR